MHPSEQGILPDDRPSSDVDETLISEAVPLSRKSGGEDHHN